MSYLKSRFDTKASFLRHCTCTPPTQDSVITRWETFISYQNREQNKPILLITYVSLLICIISKVLRVHLDFAYTCNIVDKMAFYSAYILHAASCYASRRWGAKTDISKMGTRCESALLLGIQMYSSEI